MLLRCCLAALFLLSCPERLPEEPASITMQLPLSRLVGVTLPIGTKGAAPLVLRLNVPPSLFHSLPAAEIRLNRVFAQKPVDIVVEMSSSSSFRPSTIHRDVEKLMFDGHGGEHYLRIWAEVAGVVRPGSPLGFGEEAHIAIVYEQLLWGVPRSSLPIIFGVVVALGIIWLFGARQFQQFLDPTVFKAKDS